MDSRQLYSAAEHLSTVITWNNDWIHFGTGTEVKYELVVSKISEYLGEEPFQIVLQRENSASISLAETRNIIQNLLGTTNFQLWNNTMNRAIQFRVMGVMMTGEKSSTIE
jgi:hypothetical protein